MVVASEPKYVKWILANHAKYTPKNVGMLGFVAFIEEMQKPVQSGHD